MVPFPGLTEFGEGYAARKRGEPITANPYQRPVIDRPTEASRAWRQGWREADWRILGDYPV